MGKESPVIVLLSLLLHFLLMLHPPLGVSGKFIIVKMTGESFKIWHIFKAWLFTSLLQCVSVIDFFNKNLFETPANYMCSKAISNLLYIPKFILKLHLDVKLQVTVVYSLNYKRDFSYCQISDLQNVKRFILTLRTTICFGVSIIWFFHHVVIGWLLSSNYCGYSKFMEVICAFDDLQ